MKAKSKTTKTENGQKSEKLTGALASGELKENLNTFTHAILKKEFTTSMIRNLNFKVHACFFFQKSNAAMKNNLKSASSLKVKWQQLITKMWIVRPFLSSKMCLYIKISFTKETKLLDVLKTQGLHMCKSKQCHVFPQSECLTDH